LISRKIRKGCDTIQNAAARRNTAAAFVNRSRSCERSRAFPGVAASRGSVGDAGSQSAVSPLLAGDVAMLYGVEPREISQAVKNNPMKFPVGYVFDLTKEEVDSLKSKILTLDAAPGRGHYSKRGYKSFTEKGLYMLATILKGERAVQTTIKIIESYAQLRSMVADMESLQRLKDGSPEQAKALSSAGHKLANIIGENLSTDSTETTIELNLAVLKISHKVTRTKKRK